MEASTFRRRPPPYRGSDDANQWSEGVRELMQATNRLILEAREDRHEFGSSVRHRAWHVLKRRPVRNQTDETMLDPNSPLYDQARPEWLWDEYQKFHATEDDAASNEHADGDIPVACPGPAEEPPPIG